jgi:hypothetical protein
MLKTPWKAWKTLPPGPVQKRKTGKIYVEKTFIFHIFHSGTVENCGKPGKTRIALFATQNTHFVNKGLRSPRDSAIINLTITRTAVRRCA